MTVLSWFGDGSLGHTKNFRHPFQWFYHTQENDNGKMAFTTHITDF